MITDDEEDTPDKWHYLAVKSIARLFRGITSSNNRDFYCLGCLHSFRTDNALKKHERLCDNHDYCEIVMPTEDNNALKYNRGEKSLKVANIIYMDLESLLIKQQSSQNNPEKSYTEKLLLGYSINLVRSYEPNKNIRNFYRGKDCIKKLCEDLKTQAMEVINFEKKDMIPLTDDEIKYYEERKYCHICKRKFGTDENGKNKFKLYCKVRDHCHYTEKYRGAAHSICNLRYKIQRESPVVLHNGSTYDCHFIIKELAKQFEGNMECIGENMEKYIYI